MDILLTNNINYSPQIKGFGETTTTFYLQINFANLVKLNPTANFIISINITINNYKYYYTNIYSAKDIDNDNNLPIGNITVIGNVDTEEIVANAEITYLNNPS